MRLTGTQLVEVYRAANLGEAYAIRIALEDLGIQVTIDGEGLQGGEYPLGWSTAPRIMVVDSDAKVARELIERVQRRTTRDIDLRCLACGQVMESAEKCSACGWTYEAQPITEDGEN